MSQQPTPRERIRDMLAPGPGQRRWTQREIAQALGRSPSMVSQIARGRKPGRLYAAALEQLHRDGTATPPPRRRAADGHVVPVRARGGLTTPPDPTPPTREGLPPLPTGRQGGGARVVKFEHGGRLIEVTAPKSEGVGRDRGRTALMDALRSAAKSQAHGRRHGRIVLTTASGATRTLGSKGGYQVSTLLGKSKQKGDPFRMLSEESAKLPATSDSPEIDTTDPIISVEITVW